jgi:hypothetical protein
MKSICSAEGLGGVEGAGQHLQRCDQDVEGFGWRETAGWSSISVIGYGWLRGYEGEVREQGESEGSYEYILK